MVRSKFQAMLAETWKPEKSGDQIEGEIFLLDAKVLTKELVPFVELLDTDGVPTQVLLGNYALQKVYYNSDVEEGGYLGIRYDGESKTIAKAGNFAKLFSVFYYKPGDWERDEKGEVSGKICNLNKPSARRTERLAESTPEPEMQIPFHTPQSEEPFDINTPETRPSRSKAKK